MSVGGKSSMNKRCLLSEIVFVSPHGLMLWEGIYESCLLLFGHLNFVFALLSVLVEPKGLLKKGTCVQSWQKGFCQFSEASFIQEGFCIKITREHGCLNANTHVKIGILHHSAGKQVQHRKFLTSTSYPSGISVKGLSIQGFRGKQIQTR